MTNKNHLDNKFTYNLDGCNGIKFSALDGTRTTDETWFFKYEQADVYVRYVFIPSRMGENAFTLQAGRGKRNGKRGGLGCDQVDTVKHIFPVLEKRMREILHAQGWQETEYKDRYDNSIWLRPAAEEDDDEEVVCYDCLPPHDEPVIDEIYDDREPRDSDVNIELLTIQVKCTSCNEVADITICAESLDSDYTLNEDGETYTSLYGECAECLTDESDEDRLERQAQAHLEAAALHRDDPLF